MVFVPFTGVDHHFQCVTFGAGLISTESIESYVWLLKAFLKAHGTQPTLVLSDQDPSMLQVVPMVFTESRHRLCMWHIMKKLPSKVYRSLSLPTCSITLIFGPAFTGWFGMFISNLKRLSPAGMTSYKHLGFKTTAG
ncbi:putative MULE transposase domain, FHY3/FAR1 family [Helianthus annuus]|nr:putative MULE transposase domain, FHY3/FAR1 family [Helianthus annuus]